ncbi:hypothetical protein PCASD_14025 [Puccinia coronata f. sp. avenae]|uniref:Uncharacterized protein n=1 Tax=Puccinia coronata f. sp. avenae TaxID=200324 RepID=A0A2N5TAT0_9BASI|nr:hypothetical protein PCASD_14025 [Puccinia coronata f. sp. avenae]
MEGGCTSIIQEAAKGANPALHGSGSLGESEGPGITDLKSLHLEHEGQDTSALHSQPPPDGSLEPQPENTLPSGPDSTKPSRRRIRKSVRDKFSKTIRSIRDWWSTSTTGKLSANDENLHLLGHTVPDGKMDLLDHAFLDGRLDKTIEEFKKFDLPIENGESGLYAESSIVKELESFKRMKDELREVETSIDRKPKEIFQGIQPSPRKSKEQEPVEVLENTMAISFYKDLDEDLKSLEHSLPQKVKYLMNTHGLMGPRDVLKPLVELGFRKYLETEEVFSHFNFESSVSLFLKEVEKLNDNLAKLAKFNQLEQPSNMKPDLPILQDIETILRPISLCEGRLNFAFENRLERVIEMIKNMDLYRKYMQELRGPRSLEDIKKEIELSGKIRQEKNKIMNSIY